MQEELQELIKRQERVEFEERNAPLSLIHSEVLVHSQHDGFIVISGNEIINKEDVAIYRERDCFNSVTRLRIFVMGVRVFNESYKHTGPDEDSEEEKSCVEDIFNATWEEIIEHFD